MDKSILKKAIGIAAAISAAGLLLILFLVIIDDKMLGLWVALLYTNDIYTLGTMLLLSIFFLAGVVGGCTYAIIATIKKYAEKPKD